MNYNVAVEIKEKELREKKKIVKKKIVLIIGKLILTLGLVLLTVLAGLTLGFLHGITVNQKKSLAVISEYRWKYKQLNETEKIIYESIYETVQNDELDFSVDVPKIDSDKIEGMVDRTLEAFCSDYPELFWLTGGGKYSVFDKSKYSTLNMSLNCWSYWNFTIDKKGEFDKMISKASEITEQAAVLPTTYDKVKYVHDYLVKNVEYDYIAAEKNDQPITSKTVDQANTAYGCLVNGKAVCGGYAKAFQLLMIMLGIECEYVRGEAGESHAWNCLKLDGEYYWFDVTWDDQNNSDYPELVLYNYFGCSTDDLYKTHKPFEKFDIPQCSATSYNFFVREECYIEKYDFDTVIQAIGKQKETNQINLKFGNINELYQAKKELFIDGLWFTIPEFSEKKIVYFCHDTQCAMYILVVE